MSNLNDDSRPSRKVFANEVKCGCGKAYVEDFISHSSQDNAKALAVAQWLEQNGWDKQYFLDITPSRGLSPGEGGLEALKTAADRCEAVLLLISPAWRDSKWCVTEFQLAQYSASKCSA